MLDAFKKRGAGDDGKAAKEQVAELRELIGQAREERAALSTMLTQVEVHGSKLSTRGRSMQDVNDRAVSATEKMVALAKRLSTVEARATGLEEIGNRIETLRGGVSKVEETTQQLLAPNGELQKHRHEVQQLSVQATRSVALLDAMKKEQSTLDEFRERLRVTQTEVEDSASKAMSLKADFDRLRGLTGKLTTDHTRLKNSLGETREQATATIEAVRDVEKKLGPLAEMNELSKSTETRMATLNSLAEHVLQKVKVLEQQKHTVEHAVVESNRLNEMVWNMDVQVAKLKDGTQQATQVEEIVNRIEVLTNETIARLDQATQTKESFTRELDKLEHGRDELTDFVRGCFERLTVKQKELDAFDERLKSLLTGLSNSEKSINSLEEREKDLGALGQRTEGLEKRVAGLMSQTEDLQKKQTELETLRDRLAQVDELTKRISYQFGAIEKSREDLEGRRREIQEFYTTHTALSKTVATLASDKKAFEGFLQRTDEFSREIPVLDSKIDALTSKLSVVEEGTQKAESLVAVAKDLDRQMTRIAGHQQLVEKVEARLNTLNTLSTEVDSQMQEQLGQRAEVESLKSLCDGLAIQVTDARQQVDGVSATQQKLLPLTVRVAELKHEVDKTGAAFREVKRNDAAITAQEKRLAELVDQSRAVAADVDERALQVQELTTELSAGGTIKDELADELGRVQTRQREVTVQIQLFEDQLTRVDQQMRQLDERRSQLAFADRKLEAFEGRLGELKVLSADVERKTQAVESRQAFVGAVKAEVEEVQEISARSKADLQHVVKHRSKVDALRVRVEEALLGIAETEERVAVIESRRKLVDDVQRKTDVIVNVLEDVRVNLEMVSEHKVMIDHVVENVATLDVTLREAQATLKRLRIERELAERIERGIKNVRGKTGNVGSLVKDTRSA